MTLIFWPGIRRKSLTWRRWEEGTCLPHTAARVAKWSVGWGAGPNRSLGGSTSGAGPRTGTKRGRETWWRGSSPSTTTPCASPGSRSQVHENLDRTSCEPKRRRAIFNWHSESPSNWHRHRLLYSTYFRQVEKVNLPKPWAHCLSYWFFKINFKNSKLLLSNCTHSIMFGLF